MPPFAHSTCTSPRPAGSGLAPEPRPSLQYTSVSIQVTIAGVVQKEFCEPEVDIQEDHDAERTLVAHGSNIKSTTEENTPNRACRDQRLD